MNACPICEDLTWLLDTGETHPEVITKRLEISRPTLLRHLAADRCNRPDLMRRLDQRPHYSNRRIAA